MAFYITKNIANYRNSAEILEIVEAFEHCTLPLSEWNQKIYLTLAFWYLYLNSLTEAQRLMSEGLLRYGFENGLIANQFSWTEKAESRHILTSMNDCIKLYKGEKSFVALANMVLKRFTGRNLQLEKNTQARVFFPQVAINPIKVEESR